MIRDRSAKIRGLMARCKGDPAKFAASVLGRDGERAYWSRQLEVCRSVVEARTTVVPAGNGVGKSYVASGIVLWFLYTHAPSIVFTTAPTQYTLESVLWEEIGKAARRLAAAARRQDRRQLARHARPRREVVRLRAREQQGREHVGQALGRPARGRRRGVGAPPVVFEALDSLNPSRMLHIGNPLRPDGPFFELCRKADEPGVDPSLLRKITIPSTESPDIGLARSPRGMADAGWLAAMRSQYGEDSLWWLSHVLALFPGDADDALICRAWLDLAGRTIHVPAGPSRLAIDLGLGQGNGDRTVLIARDDNGVLAWRWSRSWNFEAAAEEAKALAERYGVHRSTGELGHERHRRRLRESAGGRRARRCPGYIGGRGVPSTSFFNFRSAAAWAARRRLDPDRVLTPEDGVAVARKQHAFAIPPELLALGLRDEILAHHYTQTNLGGIKLEDGESVRARLRRSPDLADAFFQSFAFLG